MASDRMRNIIPEGAFLIARKIFKSRIWREDPLRTKLWLWLIGNANHANCQKNGRWYRRGEVVTTYDEICEGLAYREGNRTVRPSKRQVRTILDWLVKEGMIEKVPLRKEKNKTISSTSEMTQGFAYVGIRISIVNYDTYQTLDNYSRTPYGHDNKNDSNNIDSTDPHLKDNRKRNKSLTGVSRILTADELRELRKKGGC